MLISIATHPCFDKEFVSPNSDNGGAYYGQVLDSNLYKAPLIHLQVTPKRKGEILSKEIDGFMTYLCTKNESSHC